MKSLLSIITIALLFLTSSCDETQKVINTASNVQLNGNYKINTVLEKEYASKNLVLGFDALNKAMNATTECNTLFGSYTIDLYAINFGDIASTKKYCEGKMDAEKEISEALDKTGSFTLEEGQLKFFSANDRSLVLTATKIRETNEN
ncbi:META domain-containing protein [uncultured Planktosalinus sp.]|mgnify:CR=1 FL=1|uniref:META domain-containing protein n=1 Tax=uncultured Planktosalinus sp. TaxID=1810935 RepID=UPI0030D75816|tara:strand:- start:260 stop:700 length:441 start_codon:yes stop_codon:yes gene_type:complete